MGVFRCLGVFEGFCRPYNLGEFFKVIQRIQISISNLIASCVECIFFFRLRASRLNSVLVT